MCAARYESLNLDTLVEESIGDRLLRAGETAAVLGVSVRTIWSLRASNALPAVQIGAATRFRASDVRKLVREGVKA